MNVVKEENVQCFAQFDIRKYTGGGKCIENQLADQRAVTFQSTLAQARVAPTLQAYKGTKSFLRLSIARFDTNPITFY